MGDVTGEKQGEKKIRALIAGSDPMVMRIVERCVRSHGGYVLVGGVFTCVDLRRMLRTSPVDLVLIEPAFSRRGNLEAVRIVQNESAAMMIAVSRISEAGEVDALLGYRFFDFILKPFGVDRLDASLTAFQKFCERRSRLSGRLGQDDVDELLTLRRAAIVTEGASPKGLQRECVARILGAFERDPSRTLSVDDVAGDCGVSRTTAWRYLEHLVTGGLLSKTPSFRSVGRPVFRYRKT